MRKLRQLLAASLLGLLSLAAQAQKNTVTGKITGKGIGVAVFVNRSIPFPKYDDGKTVYYDLLGRGRPVRQRQPGGQRRLRPLVE